jgi:hypothetical protein
MRFGVRDLTVYVGLTSYRTSSTELLDCIFLKSSLIINRTTTSTNTASTQIKAGAFFALSN